MDIIHIFAACTSILIAKLVVIFTEVNLGCIGSRLIVKGRNVFLKIFHPLD